MGPFCTWIRLIFPSTVDSDSPNGFHIQFATLQFATYDELRRFLKAMGPAEMERYRENARDYLSSAMFQPFRKEAFVDIFVRAVEEDTGLRLRGPA